MTLPFKIVLINLAIALITSVFFTTTISSYFFAFGIISFWEGVVDLIVGLFLLIKTDKRYSQGFLLSAGLLMLLGIVVCSNTLFK